MKSIQAQILRRLSLGTDPDVCINEKLATKVERGVQITFEFHEISFDYTPKGNMTQIYRSTKIQVTGYSQRLNAQGICTRTMHQKQYGEISITYKVAE